MKSEDKLDKILMMHLTKLMISRETSSMLPKMLKKMLNGQQIELLKKPMNLKKMQNMPQKILKEMLKKLLIEQPRMLLNLKKMLKKLQRMQKEQLKEQLTKPLIKQLK